MTMKKIISGIFIAALLTLLVSNKIQPTNAQSASCGTVCSQYGCYGTCTRIGQYCLQPPASCPAAGADVVEQVFQCLGYPPKWQSLGTQAATSSCCGTCGLPSPTPMNGSVCTTGAVQVLFTADRLPNPQENVVCEVIQSDMSCAPCQGLLKSDSCIINSSSTNQNCTMATIDAACRDFVYKCRLNGTEFTSGVVPNPVNNSTSYISITLPNASTVPTACSCNVQADSNGWTDNFCFHSPDTVGCPMTAAGGYCDPNGDKSYSDADWVKGYYDHLYICGNGNPQRPPPTATPASQNCYNSCLNTGKPPDVCSAMCRPTNTPTPSFTPTPTKFQNQTAITVAPTFSPIGNDRNPPSNMNAQRWACVNSSPCSEITSLCRNLDPTADDTKRAKLNGANLLPSHDTYILECLINTDAANGPQVGPQCTTGDETVDAQILGTSILPELRSKYGYQLIGIFDQSGTPIPAGKKLASDAQGKIGPIEWESKTPGHRIGHMFVAMNPIDPLGYQGNDPVQKQGIFDLTDLPTTRCLMLTWDPEGIVFDVTTKKPLEGATVTIFKKSKNGEFESVTGNDVLGGIINPFKTGKDGRYMFRVPDGVYKMTIEAEGYKIISRDHNTSNFSPYSDIYYGEEFEEKGGPKHFDIAMEPKKNSIIEKILHLIGLTNKN